MTAKQITPLESVKAKSLRDTGFTLDEDKSELKRRLIVAVDGESGAGKNRFAFTFPDPIAFLSFDPNYEKALKEARKMGKRVYRKGYSLPIVKPDGKEGDKIAGVFGDIWDEFAVDYMGAIRDRTIATVVIDTATELFELVTYAIYGKNVQVMPKERGHAYATYRQVIREAENTDKSLVLLHKMKDEWKNDKSTGKLIRAGYKDTGYCVNTEVLMSKHSDEPYPERYHASIVKCHLNPAIEYDGDGTGDLTGDLISYDTLAELIFSE